MRLHAVRILQQKVSSYDALQLEYLPIRYLWYTLFVCNRRFC